MTRTHHLALFTLAAACSPTTHEQPHATAVPLVTTPRAASSTVPTPPEEVPHTRQQASTPVEYFRVTCGEPDTCTLTGHLRIASRFMLERSGLPYRWYSQFGETGEGKILNGALIELDGTLIVWVSQSHFAQGWSLDAINVTSGELLWHQQSEETDNSSTVYSGMNYFNNLVVMYDASHSPYLSLTSEAFYTGGLSWGSSTRRAIDIASGSTLHVEEESNHASTRHGISSRPDEFY